MKPLAIRLPSSIVDDISSDVLNPDGPAEADFYPDRRHANLQFSHLTTDQIDKLLVRFKSSKLFCQLLHRLDRIH